MSETWIDAGAADRISPEDVAPFEHQGRQYALYRTADDRYFATDGLCTHEQVELADEGDASNRLGRLLRRGGIEIEHRDFRALGGERLRRRPAEPRASAGHDRRNPGKFHRASFPLVAAVGTAANAKRGP